MTIKEISYFEFNDFSRNHLLSNPYQTSYYGEIKKSKGYEVLYIGAYKNSKLIGASLIISKLIAPTIKYGYAPRGFLIDYYDEKLIKEFTKAIKSFFFSKNYAFIKINPEIIYSIINPEDLTKKINVNNENLISFLKLNDYQKLKSTLYFDSILPIYNPIIDLTEYKEHLLDKKTLTEIKKTEMLNLTIRIGNEEDIKNFYDLIKDKKEEPLEYYINYYNSYKSEDLIDLFLLELDFAEYLKLLQKKYDEEEEINELLNNKFIHEYSDIDLLNKKMESDIKLNEIKKEIISVTKTLKEEKNKFMIAGSLVTKYQNRVTVIINGHDKNFSYLNSKLFLFHYMINYYKKENYDYFDMNGITADFTDGNPYKKLNDFKLSFKPNIYEYIGEFDLIINSAYYQMLWSTGKLHKEFQKERISQD